MHSGDGKSGNNGKSTAVNLFRNMLGDYGCHTPTETLLVRQYDNNIPADRRVRVLPFSIKIPDRDLDQYLPDKLHAELPGVLAWAVRGCLKWQAEGLSSPKAVHQATADWQCDMNHLTKFFNDLVILAPDAKIAASQLFSRYETWCSDNGEAPLKIQEFNAKFQQKYDVTHTRIKGRSWWRGVKFLE
jgi:phage/plasmid-associated DNA primase